MSFLSDLNAITFEQAKASLSLKASFFRRGSPQAVHLFETLTLIFALLNVMLVVAFVFLWSRFIGLADSVDRVSLGFYILVSLAVVSVSVWLYVKGANLRNAKADIVDADDADIVERHFHATFSFPTVFALTFFQVITFISLVAISHGTADSFLTRVLGLGLAWLFYVGMTFWIVRTHLTLKVLAFYPEKSPTLWQRFSLLITPLFVALAIIFYFGFQLAKVVAPEALTSMSAQSVSVYLLIALFPLVVTVSLFGRFDEMMIQGYVVTKYSEDFRRLFKLSESDWSSGNYDRKHRVNVTHSLDPLKKDEINKTEKEEGKVYVRHHRNQSSHLY
ncbi:MAG: hypothetical protein LBI13_08815 [Streptococcaceae bacterium]|jgi:hypothetical protein|nr:hypothetical protein [Streptococcaceae bacterium]